MERTDRDVGTLNRPEGNDLKSNYDAHDVGSEHVVATLEDWGYYAEDWGIDLRDEDDTLIFDDKMDMRVRDSHGAVAGYVDVKCKRSDGWMGVFNERHFDHYMNIAEQTELPVAVWMCRVNRSDTKVLRDFVIPIDPDEEPGGKWRAPDGNMVVEFSNEQRNSPLWLRGEMLG